MLAWVYMYHMWAGGHRGQKTVLKSVVSFHVAPGTRHAVAHRHTCKTNIHKHKIKTFSKMTNASTSTLHLNLRAKSLYTLGLSVRSIPPPQLAFWFQARLKVPSGSRLQMAALYFSWEYVLRNLRLLNQSIGDETAKFEKGRSNPWPHINKRENIS